MTAREHLSLCEGKRGGATVEERALCADLAASQVRIAELEKVLRHVANKGHYGPQTATIIDKALEGKYE